MCEMCPRHVWHVPKPPSWFCTMSCDVFQLTCDVFYNTYVVWFQVVCVMCPNHMWSVYKSFVMCPDDLTTCLNDPWQILETPELKQITPTSIITELPPNSIMASIDLAISHKPFQITKTLEQRPRHTPSECSRQIPWEFILNHFLKIHIQKVKLFISHHPWSNSSGASTGCLATHISPPCDVPTLWISIAYRADIYPPAWCGMCVQWCTYLYLLLVHSWLKCCRLSIV